jgi:membrane-anchored mycosin MYCP
VTADRTGASGTGAGVVNPYAAVAAVLPEEEDRVSGSVRPQVPPPVARTPAGADLRTRRLAVGTALGGAVTVLAVLGAGATVQVGRRRRWRPQRRSPGPASGQGPGTGPGQCDGGGLSASGRHARRT